MSKMDAHRQVSGFLPKSSGSFILRESLLRADLQYVFTELRYVLVIGFFRGKMLDTCNLLVVERY